MGKILAVFACLGLTGCIAPPIVTYVTLAMDGASFLTTGKSVGDHVLSVAVNEDCALLRVLTEQGVAAVCREYPDEKLGADLQEAATALTFEADFEIPLLEVEPEKVPLLVANDPEPLLSDAVTPVAFTEGPGTVGAGYQSLGGTGYQSLGNQSAVYLMIGNFSSKESAELLAARVTGQTTGQLAGIRTAVAPAMAGESLYFRVIAGPIAPGETSAAQSRLAAAGFNNSWAAKLCSQNLGAPPCNE